MAKQEKQAKQPKQKTRAKTRLKQKISKEKSHNRSEDLTKLTEDYNAFCKRLEGLVKALKNQHAAMEQLSKAKFQVAQHLAVLAKDTVLYETTGQTAGVDRSTDSVNSYFSIQEDATKKNTMYASKYKQFVIDYAEEWYKTITERVGADLKKAETMRVELDHYQSKVEALRLSANSTMAKGKQVDGKAAEKLTRNEDKLIKTKESTTKFINDLCLLIEEITERSWRDLHPLLIKCSQFETQVTGEEAKAMASLTEVVTALKKVASDNGITPQARLANLGKLDPHVLSTRSKDDNRNYSNFPTIEDGLSGLAVGGSSKDGGSVYSNGTDNNSSYYPVGTTAPQGLGGFPVRLTSEVSGNSNGSNHSSTSTNNKNGAPSTMSMMNMNAAPAPTLDTMAQAFGSPVPTMGGSMSDFSAAPTPTMSGSVSNFGAVPTMGGSISNIGATPAPPPSSAPPPPPPSTPGAHSTNLFGGPPATTPGHYGGPPAPSPGAAPNPFGGPPATTPGQYGGPPAPSPMTGMGMGMGMNGGGMYGKTSTPGGYPQQSPMAGNFAQHQSPMAGNFAQHQSPMGMGFHQQQSPGGFSQQQSPMGGGMNFAQQQSPMAGNFAQQPSMYPSMAQRQQQATPHAAYGHNPFG